MHRWGDVQRERGRRVFSSLQVVQLFRLTLIESRQPFGMVFPSTFGGISVARGRGRLCPPLFSPSWAIFCPLLRGCLVFRDSAPLDLDDTASSHVQWLCLIVALGALHPQKLGEQTQRDLLVVLPVQLTEHTLLNAVIQTRGRDFHDKRNKQHGTSTGRR